MKSTFAAIAAALSLALASGAAAAAVPGADPAGLAKRDPNGASCLKFYEGLTLTFQVTSWGTWDDDWGHGFLDNLRGQCSSDLRNIEDWSFYYDQGAPPTNGHSQFHGDSSSIPDTHCVENAIWLASNPTGAIWGVECQWK